MENMNTDRSPININLVVKMLTEEGKSRKDIQTHYGLSGAEAKILFAHEKVKGLKTKKIVNLIIVDEPLAEVTADANPGYIKEPVGSTSFTD